MIVLCMSPAERTIWDRTIQFYRGDIRPIRLPCVDCTPAFSARMGKVYRCNGYPGMAAPPPIPTKGTAHRRGPEYAEARLERRRASWRAYGARRRAKRAG